MQASMNEPSISSVSCDMQDGRLGYKHFLESEEIPLRIKEEVTLCSDSYNHSENKLIKTENENGLISEHDLLYESHQAESSSFKEPDYKIHLEDIQKVEPASEIFFNPEEISITPINTDQKPLTKPRKKRVPTAYQPDAFKCECGYVAKSISVLNRHLITHQSDEEAIWHECDKCPFKTKHKDSLRAHHKNMHSFCADKKSTEGDGTYYCANCDFGTKNLHAYRKHSEQHMDSSLFFFCDLCDFRTRRRKNLKTHILTHKSTDETKMHKCPHCLFETKYKSSLSSHILTHFDPNQGRGRGNWKVDEKIRATFKFKCSHCEFKGKTREVVKNHELIHIPDDLKKVLRCYFENCPFRTARKSALARHYLIHQTEEEVTWYKCTSCTFQTRHKGSLKNHLISHKTETEYTNYACDYCPFNTKWKNCFKRHVLTHVKQGVCEISE